MLLLSENSLFSTACSELDSFPRIDSGHKTVARISRIGGRFDIEDFSGKSKGHLSQRETLEHKFRVDEETDRAKNRLRAPKGEFGMCQPPLKNALGSVPPKLVRVSEGANDSSRD
jgi:hypothetical protein